MNMISNGAFQTEMDLSNKQNELVSKLVSAWEKKNNKVARAGGVSLMALSLAACGSEDDTPFSQSDIDTAVTAALTGADGTVYTNVDAAVTAGAASVDITSDNATVIAAATSTLETQVASLQTQLDALTDPVSLSTTTDTDTLSGTSGNDTFTATQATLATADIIVDNSSTDSDTLNITATDDITTTPTVVGIENVNYTIQAFATTTGTTFAIANAGVAASTINIDLDQVGSSIVSTTITGVATGSTVNASDDFTGTVTVTGDDNAAVTVNAIANTIVANSGGALTGATLTSTAATGRAVFDTDSDAAATLTAANTADMDIDAVAALTVTGTSGGSLNAQNGTGSSENLTAATSVNLTAADEIIVTASAATAATLSAGFGDAAAVTDSTVTGAALTDLNLSGNGSAPTFDIRGATSVDTINVSGDQNVTVRMGLDDIAGLAAANALSVTDSSSGTLTVRLEDGTGAADLTGVAADEINLSTSNNAAVTYASGANVVVSNDQTSGSFDGTDAGAASNTLSLTMNDGVATGGATTVLNGVTFTDLASVTIDGSVDDSGTTLTALTASADNTDITINAGANGVTLAGTTTLGTGDLVINSSAAIAGGAIALTANSLTTSGAGGLTMTAIDVANLPTVTTDSGADALTISGTGATSTISTGAGNDTVTLSAATQATFTYTIDAGDGALDTLVLNDLINYSAVTIALSGFERISLALDATNVNTAVTVANANITGQSFIMSTNDSAVNTITVSMASTEAISDLSNLVFDANYSAANDVMVISNNVTTNLTLTGSDMIDQFTSGAGNDTMSGGAGADVLNAAAGNNTVDGGAGDDTITTTTGTDTITGGAGADTINSGAGVDTITAGEGADIVISGAGADVISLTETTSAADNVVIGTLTEGGSAGTAAGTFTGFNVISGFQVVADVAGTSDDVVFDGDGNGDDTVGTDLVDGTLAVIAGTAATTASNDLTTANYTDVDSVVNFYNDNVTNGTITNHSTAGGDDDIMAVTLGSGTAAMTAIYHIVDDGAAIDAAEVTLIATVDATLAAGDIIL